MFEINQCTKKFCGICYQVLKTKLQALSIFLWCGRETKCCLGEVLFNDDKVFKKCYPQCHQQNMFCNLKFFPIFPDITDKV